LRHSVVYIFNENLLYSYIDTQPFYRLICAHMYCTEIEEQGKKSQSA